MGLDPERDELSLYPLLYWPMDPREKNLSPKALSRIGMPDEIVMRHRPPHFGHVFSGGGYAAAMLFGIGLTIGNIWSGKAML